MSTEAKVALGILLGILVGVLASFAVYTVKEIQREYLERKARRWLERERR